MESGVMPYCYVILSDVTHFNSYMLGRKSSHLSFYGSTSIAYVVNTFTIFFKPVGVY